MIKGAMSRAFCKVAEHLETDGPPDMWDYRAVKVYDLLMELEDEIEKEIFTRVFISNETKDNDQ